MTRKSAQTALALTALLLMSPSATLLARQDVGGQDRPLDGAGDLMRFRNAGMVLFARRGTPDVDGRLEPSEWGAAEPVTGFTQFQPDTDVPATVGTQGWLLYDDRFLYLGFRCEQREVPIQDYLTRRDHLPGDPDWVGVILDPFLTWQEAYFFCVNPVGVQMDGMIGADGNGDVSWDGLWRCAAVRDEEGWTAELAIPWKTLRFPRRPEQTWGVNLVRSLGEKGEMSTWAPLDIGANSLVTADGLLEGISGVQPGRALWINPYATVRMAREGQEAVDGSVRPDWSGQQGLEYMGVDLRTGLGSNLVLDLTVNPDFGHIEADQEQVNFSPYELYFEEKRPFFLEGMKTFEMPLNLFYSRRVHNPVAGAKLTGQVGATQVGLISAWDEPLGGYDSFPYRAQSVLRLKQDIGTASYIGGMVTSQDVPAQSGTGGGYQRNLGLDFDLRPSDYLRLVGMGAVADAPGIGQEADLWWLAGAYSSRTWNWDFSFTDAGRDFEAYMGYLPRPGQQRLGTEGGYRYEADWGPLKWFTPGLGYERFQYPDGELIEQGGGFGLSFEFRKRDNLNIRGGRWQVQEGGVTHGGRDLYIEYNANRSGAWTGHAGLNVGEGFDYGDFDVTGDERVLANRVVWAGATWRPTVRATFSVGGNLVRRSLFFRTPAIDEVGILRLTGQYQFTRELFGRLYLQARRDHTDQDLDGGEVDRRLLVNALLGYEIGPGSVFYLAYNHYDLGRDLLAGEPDRVLFLKVARLFTP